MRYFLIVLLAFQLAHADPASQAQKALKGLTSPSLEKRLDANAVLESLEPEKIKKNGALVSACIAALSQAARREKDRFRPGDYARCLMRYTGVSSNPEKDLTSILPLLTHSSSEVVLYSWAGVGEWAGRPLKQPVIDKLLALLDHPREQVRINALMWLCRRADIQSALQAGKPLNALQQSTWQRLLSAAQQSQSLRLSTAALRFLIQYADLDRVKVLAVLGSYLTRDEIDEKELLTYLGSPDETVRLAAAYSLACLGGSSQPLRQWIGAALKAGRHDGLLLGAIRRSHYQPVVLPPTFQVTTGDSLLLKHMAGQPDPHWAPFLGYLQEGLYPMRCWRGRSLADKEATLAALDLLVADAPKFSQEPLALKLLMGSADPELAQAAARCYQTLWKP